MNNETRAKSILAVLLVIVIAGVLIAAVPHDSRNADTYIVHTGDTHGLSGGLDFDNAADIRNGLGDGAFLFDTGDSMQGAGLNTLTRGEAAVKIMNAAGYDAACLGPHDFSYGPDVLLERADEMDFPLLCANLFWRSSGEPVLEEYTIIEKGNVRMGVFGLISPAVTGIIKPGYLKDMTIVDPVGIAEKMVGILEGKDVDMIVALGSLGEGGVSAAEIASSVKGIDVFLEGGYNPEKGRTADVSGTIISSPGYGFSEIGVISLSGTPEATLVSAHTGSDAATAEAIKEQAERHQAFMDKVVGHSHIEIFGGDRAGFVSEIPMGDFTADAMIHKTGADVAFINGGFIRDSIHPGDVTAGMICDALPFENQTVTVRATGADLLEALEWGLRVHPAETGAFPQFAGMSVQWDPEASPLHRVVSVQIGGEPIDPEKTYTVATTDYVSSGGDGYTMLALPAEREWGMAFQTVIDYVQFLKDIGSLETGRLAAV